jgi:uncharacterized protein YeaO (DUF488 family)
MPGLKLKSLKEPTEPHDGFRILIAQYRPRYLPKSEENWHEWWKELAPSRQLHKAYMIDKKMNWSVYKNCFLAEIKNSPDALDEIKELKQLSKDQDVTLLCHCVGMDKHCHRFVISELVEKGSRS